MNKGDYHSKSKVFILRVYEQSLLKTGGGFEMKKTSKILSLVLSLAMTLSLCVTAGAADTTTAVTKGDIVVLYTNDVHCAVDDNIGYAGLVAYRTDMQKATDYVTLVDAGDALQGAPLGTLSKGEYLVQIMNQVGYDVAVPGNHEFDYGMDQFLAMAKEQKSGYICCNFMNLKTNKPVFDAYKMVTYGSTKVAYVGIDTPESISKSTPSYFQDASGNYIYGFCQGNNGKDLYAAVQSAVDAAKKDGANYVIAVGHCGIDEQSAPWRSTDIIANVSGLNAFIDGHSHSVIASQAVKDKDGKTVPLTSSGTKLANIGKVVIKSDGTITTGLVAKDDYTTKDTATTTLVNSIKAQNDTLLKKVVARSDVALTILGSDGKRAVRNAETNLGDLCADAYRAISGADVAIVNGGGIRADIAAGDITYEDIIKVHPYGNALCVVKATGQQILDALEMASRTCPSENGGFLQVSGLTYTIDTTIPSTVKVDDNKMFVSVEGARRVKDVKVGGSAIIPNKTYTLASHNYMLKEAGDGLNMFQKDELVKDSVMLDNQVLINYITSTLNGVVPAAYAKAQGRITVVREPFADVDNSAWYYDGVVYAYENNLFSGTSATSFTPSATMTRGQLVTVLWRMAGKPTATAAAKFTDVASDAYYASAVAWASESGIVSGYTATTFNPDQAISRQQFATILYKYAQVMKYDTTAGGMAIREFSDYDQIASYATAAMGWANAAGLIKGGDNKINPTGTAQRCQVAVILTRFCQSIVAAASTAATTTTTTTTTTK
jgi:5''-nucleotidase/2'',3''-cyclic phosphodiesterase and related esterases